MHAHTDILFTFHNLRQGQLPTLEEKKTWESRLQFARMHDSFNYIILNNNDLLYLGFQILLSRV